MEDKGSGIVIVIVNPSQLNSTQYIPSCCITILCLTRSSPDSLARPATR